MLDVDKIAQRCISLYRSLPKSGKPIENEWTVLSCFVQYHADFEEFGIVSLGTGSKCIGASKMSHQGVVLNDSHAEVIARRSFLLYLYDNINKALDNKKSIFIRINNGFKLKDNIEFTFYSSQLPCGDASIIPKHGDEDHYGDIVQSRKRSNDSSCTIEIKKQKCEDDIHRTGAKCLPNSTQDLLEKGVGYHTVGQVRTKPGRGDPTLSVSCSDKLARWIHCGIQGSLLSLLLVEPIYIRHFIFGSGVPYSKESLNRALLSRTLELDPNILTCVPEIHQSSVIFAHVRSKERTKPAPGSISWCNTNAFQPEVAIQGLKLGVTKKNACKPAYSLSITKYNLYKAFLKILYKNKELKHHICPEIKPDEQSYNKMKKQAHKYLERWSEVKRTLFKSVWTVKPDLWNFLVEVSQ